MSSSDFPLLLLYSVNKELGTGRYVPGYMQALWVPRVLVHRVDSGVSCLSSLLLLHFCVCVHFLI